MKRSLIAAYLFLLLMIVAEKGVASVQLYTIVSKSDRGQITISARKEYNIWGNGANRTFYEVMLYSPLIEYKFQEVRIGIEWASAKGNYNERVIFYGTVGDGTFLQHRIDENFDRNGRYFVPNYEVVSIPKYHHYLSEELQSQHLIKYQLKIPENNTDVNIGNGVAKLEFYVDRDEPYGDNLIWINWGIFDAFEEESTSKVNGPAEPYTYVNLLTWSDYFDRPLILYIFFVISISGFVGILAGPTSILPLILLQLYVIVVPIGVILFTDLTEKMDYLAYLLEVVLRFQLVTQVSTAILAISNFLPIILMFSYLKEFMNNPSLLLDFNSSLISNFVSESLVIYFFQICINIAVFVVTAMTLHL